MYVPTSLVIFKNGVKHTILYILLGVWWVEKLVLCTVSLVKKRHYQMTTIIDNAIHHFVVVQKTGFDVLTAVLRNLNS
jgi:hypothetical protein